MNGEVHKIIEQILKLETNPSIFKVVVEATDHTDGFEARCTFRDNNPQMTQWANRGDTPEEALNGLYVTLYRHFAPCPTCGRIGPLQ